jgi:lipoyl-dependent peroxiredoxin
MLVPANRHDLNFIKDTFHFLVLPPYLAQHLTSKTISIMKRKSTAVWKGSGKDGSGTLSTQSTVLNQVQYSYKSRFEEGVGTNPEELVAAAHAGCFSMKLAFILQEAGFTADEINTECIITLDGPITQSDLTLRAKIPGITKEKFEACAKEAKDTCPISKSLSARINVTLNATLN